VPSLHLSLQILKQNCSRDWPRIAPREITRAPPLPSCLLQLARLEGYLNRRGDAPPGNTVMWHGMARLSDLELGFQMGAQLVGN